MFHYWLSFSDGVHVPSANNFWTGASQLLQTLNLLKDPADLPSGMSYDEVEDRRRLFWHFYNIDVWLSIYRGRMWPSLDTNTVSYTAETDPGTLDESFGGSVLAMRAIQHTLVVAFARIQQLTAHDSVTYDNIKELNKTLEDISTNITHFEKAGTPKSPNQVYTLKILLAFGYVLLHRPFLTMQRNEVGGINLDWHRFVAISNASSFLFILISQEHTLNKIQRNWLRS
ncbi:hypothetical protein BT69DRAFT_72576 [Atractiella rhizophila]|nr:hypothetical protein BT69DRAFT_72576 [Atractiella rhizophila]